MFLGAHLKVCEFVETIDAGRFFSHCEEVFKYLRILPISVVGTFDSALILNGQFSAASDEEMFKTELAAEACFCSLDRVQEEGKMKER
ncbi:MAG: hypothetical protein ACP5E5_06810 [Acidobacteriaceae bacterium]